MSEMTVRESLSEAIGVVQGRLHRSPFVAVEDWKEALDRNPSPDADRPQVADARALGKRDDLRRCIILFELEDGRIGYASYGATKAICDDTRDVADACYEELERQLVIRDVP